MPTLLDPAAPRMNAGRTATNDLPPTLREARLWIDGVGCWMLWFPRQFTIGGPRRRGSSVPAAADLSLFADLRSRHAVIEREGESYGLTACGPVQINGRPVVEEGSSITGAAPLRHGLRSGDELTLGDDVRFEFTVPTPLSNTARLLCPSGHRPEERIDGVLLMEQLCQLGPQPDHHIVCPQADAALVLFRRGESLWCRAPLEWTLNGRPVSGSAVLSQGVVVATEALSFRLEVP